MCAHHDHEPGPPQQQSAEAALSEAAESGVLAPKATSLLARVAMGMVRGYQKYFSAFTPPVCRFQPTCSQYTFLAIQRHGFFKGVWLGFWRIMRCHPFHPGGYDPVPDLGDQVKR